MQLDLRVVSATHRPIRALVERNEFRKDLLARLAGFTFVLPPLRQRRDDLGTFIAAFASRTPIRIAPAAGRALLRYDWPLNARELTQALHVASAVADGGVIAPAHLPREVVACLGQGQEASPQTMLHDPFRDELVACLTRHRGNVSEVARELGKARMQVQR